MIPEFRSDGYLPEGLHIATEADVTFRFGSSSTRRQRLIFRLRKWLELARATRSRRFLVDGSFVTSKTEPNDIDAVVLIADDFEQQVANGSDPAIELETMLLTRNPEVELGSPMLPNMKRLKTNYVISKIGCGNSRKHIP